MNLFLENVVADAERVQTGTLTTILSMHPGGAA